MFLLFHLFGGGSRGQLKFQPLVFEGVTLWKTNIWTVDGSETLHHLRWIKMIKKNSVPFLRYIQLNWSVRAAHTGISLKCLPFVRFHTETQCPTIFAGVPWQIRFARTLLPQHVRSAPPLSSDPADPPQSSLPSDTVSSRAKGHGLAKLKSYTQ